MQDSTDLLKIEEKEPPKESIKFKQIGITIIKILISAASK